MGWLIYALMTVCCWGLYGIFLHGGQIAMGDPENGRYKAYLFVGIAYFLTAVLAPLAILIMKGASWSFPYQGAKTSLIAGIVGAAGAFFVLLAFGAKGTPPTVMTIVFAGAPVVNALVSMAMHPPAGGYGAVRWQFVAGILLAVIGGGLVTLYKPAPGPSQTKAKPPAQVETMARR